MCIRDSKEAAYEVLDFLYEDDNIQAYIDDQNAIACKEGDYKLGSMLDGMTEYIESGHMTDYQDHYYPSEIDVYKRQAPLNIILRPGWW